MAGKKRDGVLNVWVLLTVLVATTVFLACTQIEDRDATPTPEPTPTPTPEPTPTPTPTPTPEPAPPDVDPDILRVVDKERGLPADYVPPGLVEIPHEWVAPGFEGQTVRDIVLGPLIDMLAAARADGHDIRVRSAYRSFEVQHEIFQGHLDRVGEEEARRFSAPPGHSEHQLGTAVDVTTPELGWELTEALDDTAAGQWLRANAHLYGFALSYPEDAEHITGFIFEPWHYRYIGVEHAQAWAESGLTLVEYLEGLQ